MAPTINVPTESTCFTAHAGTLLVREVHWGSHEHELLTEVYDSTR